ncbi:hypothetical protein Gotur_035662 [Gossypium turneri]
MRAPDAGEQISSKDIKMIVEQNNYININLYTIGKQLEYIENLVKSQPIKKESIKGETEKSSKEPIFTPYEIPKPFQKSHNDFLTKIQNRLDALESYKSELVAPDTQCKPNTQYIHYTNLANLNLTSQMKNKLTKWLGKNQKYYIIQNSLQRILI